MAAGLLGLVVLTAACGDDSSASGSSATTVPSTTAAPPTTAAPAGAGTSEPIEIPLQVTTDSSGGRVVVQASIGGGPTVPMLLDTGSAGIVVASSALGPEAQATSQTASTDYVDTSVHGVVAQATVTMGGLSTDGPISVLSAESATCGSSPTDQTSCPVTQAFGDGTQGIIGIGLTDGPSVGEAGYSPLLQVAAPYADGFTVQLPSSGNGQGTLTVGPVAAPSSATSVALAASTPSTYPNGATAYAKDVQLCWVVGPASACGPTDLDIGSPHTVVSPSALSGAPVTGGVVDSGTAVSVSASQGGAPLWSFTAGTTVSKDMVESVDDQGSSTAFNSGIAFFYANVVAWDLSSGQLLVWPQT